MHQQGYTFSGPTSMYKLTIPEIRVLHGGFQIERDMQEDQAKGVSPEDRQNLREFNQRLTRGEGP